MSFYPDYPDFEYQFYEVRNPQLYSLLRIYDSTRNEMAQRVKENYERREGGISNLGNYVDDAYKNAPKNNDVKTEPSLPSSAPQLRSPSKKTPEKENAKKRILELEDQFKTGRKRGTTGPVTLTAELVAEYDDLGEKIPGSETLNDTVKIGDSEFRIANDGYLTSLTGKKLKLSDANILILIENSPKDLLSYIGNQVKPEDVQTVGKYLIDAGVIGESDKKVSKVTKDNSKKEILSFYGSQLKGKGLRADFTIKYYKNVDDLIPRLEILVGERQAGNNSISIRNEIAEILQKLPTGREKDNSGPVLLAYEKRLKYFKQRFFIFYCIYR